jgi:hypothetical protein
VLDQGALDPADLDGSPDAACAAFLFAETGGRAENAARPSQDVVRLDGADGPRDVLQPQLADEGAGIGLGGAAPGAGGIMTEKASIGLGNGLRKTETFLHCLE